MERWLESSTERTALFSKLKRVLDGIRRNEDRLTLVLSLIIGALVGLVVVAFILLTGRLAARMYPSGGAGWRRILVPAAGSLVTGYLLARYFPMARGSSSNKCPLRNEADIYHSGSFKRSGYDPAASCPLPLRRADRLLCPRMAGARNQGLMRADKGSTGFDRFHTLVEHRSEQLPTVTHAVEHGDAQGQCDFARTSAARR